MRESPVLVYREQTCALGAIIAYLKSGTEFRLARLQDRDEEREEFLTLNALGEVPVLFDHGEVLTENIPILQRIGLDDTAKGLHFPVGSRRFDQLNRAMGFIGSSLHKGFAPIFSPESFHADPKVQAEITENYVRGPLRELIQHTNDHLLRTTFLYETPTVGDAYLFAITQWMGAHFDLAKDFPNVQRFREAMLKDEAVKMALEIDSGKLKSARGKFLGHVELDSFLEEAVARKLEFDAMELELIEPHAIEPHAIEQGVADDRASAESLRSRPEKTGLLTRGADPKNFERMTK